ncbi:hypothetical protein [Granulicella arctica]|uniref:hypothetical protein n=1 Tax=Granulicella arctica TaxID=940613 RepID=UPI0021E07775|nr:hypothetical protein [Granulicella arctica]
MKKLWSIGILLVSAGVAPAQMHKVAKPETVVRSVGVYEWTGELAKPTASRLIPVTLYIDKKLEDGGLYLARPVPFALGSGNIYELDEAGVAKGNLELVYARHLQAVNIAEAYDDGWFGYGSFKGLVAPRKLPTRKLQPARTAGIETNASVDPDKPHFTNKAGQPVTPASTSAAGTDTAKTDSKTTDAAADPDRPKFSKKDGSGDAGSTPADDPDRPTMKRHTDADPTATASSGTASGTTTPADDPDRPTMKRRSGNDTADTTPASSGSTPADDPDRPTLKRHTPEDAKKAKESGSSVAGVGSLNDDPDRPALHRGKPVAAMTEKELPKLSGLPVDLRQMIAVSDAANRPVHDFARPWEDDAERVAILTKMQAIAQAQLAAYGIPAAPAAAPSKSAASSTTRPANSKLRRPVKSLQRAKIPVLDEQLKGYLLSYGDVPTFVYQAHTDGEGANLRYVTVVAQLDAQHEPKMVLHTVTDAAHLDRTARLRLVDAVDVEASNRASLLFEMRGQTSRQFGVYRILGLQAEQIFSTGTMQ